MKNAVYLAIRSLRWHFGRAVTIILCLALTLWLPLTVRLLLQQFRQEISARADSTPLVIGAKGSRIDLALHALYFEALPPGTTTSGDAREVQKTGLATAIPIYAKYRTQSREGQPGVPIVGTSPDYYRFRQLRIASGRIPSVLGDCVAGYNAAKRLQLKPGDTILSAPRNAFNLAGDYPLRMNVTGVLDAAHSPDDEVIFTDTKTVWIIDGIGHGHQDISKSSDQDLVLNRDGGKVTASAAVLPYTEITPGNLDSFHFHGNPAKFPLTAVLAIPDSEKSRVLLIGRYSSENPTAQCLKPPDVVAELLSVVFRIEQLVWVSSAIAVLVTSLLLALVMALSIRLRAAEMQTMYRLGCSRRTIIMLLGAELALMLFAGSVIAVTTAWISKQFIAESLRQLLF